VSFYLKQDIISASGVRKTTLFFF